MLRRQLQRARPRRVSKLPIRDKKESRPQRQLKQLVLRPLEEPLKAMLPPFRLRKTSQQKSNHKLRPKKSPGKPRPINQRRL